MNMNIKTIFLSVAMLSSASIFAAVPVDRKAKASQDLDAMLVKVQEKVKKVSESIDSICTSIEAVEKYSDADWKDKKKSKAFEINVIDATKNMLSLD